MPVEDSDDAVFVHDALGDQQGRAAGRATRRRAAPDRTRPPRAKVGVGAAGLDAAALGVPGRGQPRDRLRPAALLARRPGPARRHRRSTSTCAGGSWSSSRCSARPTATSSQAALDAEPTARSRVEHTRAMASLPDAEAKAWAWQRFTGEVDVPNYELEAAGLGMWRGGQEHLTDAYVDRYFAELPGHRRGAQRLGARRRGARPSSRPRRCTDETLARGPGADRPTTRLDLSLRRRRSSTSPTSSSAGSRSDGRTPRRDRPMIERAAGPGRRSGPASTSSPTTASAGARTGSPPRSRWRSGSPGRARRPRRVWVTMRTPGHDFELAAGWLVHEGLAASGDIATVAYCTDADLAPEQEFNVVTVTLSAPPAATRATGTPRRPRARRRAGCAARTASPTALDRDPTAPVGRRAARPGRRTPPARAAARAPGGLRPHRRACTRRGLFDADGAAARRPRGRRPAQRRRQGGRSPGAGRVTRRAARAWWSAAGPASSWCRRRWPPGSARWSPSGRRPACPCSWPARAAWRSTGSPRPSVRALHLIRVMLDPRRAQ